MDRPQENLEPYDETFYLTPEGVKYTSTAEILISTLDRWPAKDSNGELISSMIVRDLVSFYTSHLQATHSQYNEAELEYYVDKYCWEWCCKQNHQLPPPKRGC